MAQVSFHILEHVGNLDGFTWLRRIQQTYAQNMFGLELSNFWPAAGPTAVRRFPMQPWPKTDDNVSCNAFGAKEWLPFRSILMFVTKSA